MKLTDIQSALLKDKETLFKVKGDRHNWLFVIESIETKEESYDYHWKEKTRTVNYAVGTCYKFYRSEPARTSYSGSLIEAQPARFATIKQRVRLNQVEELNWNDNLSKWQADCLKYDAERVAREAEQDNADQHFASVLSEALGIEVKSYDAQSVSTKLRDALLNHFTSVNA